MKEVKKNLNKILTSITLVFFLFAAAVFYFYFFHQDKQKFTEQNDQREVEKCAWTRRIDGVCVQSATSTNIWPVAVMIDNHPDVWPQFGLQSASVVYNTLVEGDVTRLMAVFAGSEAEKIGPVRSARPYYLPWAKEWDAFYAHSGGSPDAIWKIKEYGILDLEEATSYGPKYFYRDKNISAPHNLFTSSDNLFKALVDFNLSNSTPIFEPWLFDNNASSTMEIAEKIQIDYSAGSLFDVSYEYSTTSNSYFRFQNNEPFIAALTRNQLEVKNLIIQFVPTETHLDALDRLKINVLGQGEVFIFYNGKMVSGKWMKNNLRDRTKFYDDFGQEIIFLPGNVWIEVVPGEREVIISNKVIK